MSSSLIHGLLKIRDAGERDEAGRAVAAVCAGAPTRLDQADPVLDEYHKAAPAEQLVLLPVLGRIGGAKVLRLVREAVADPDPKRRESAATRHSSTGPIPPWPTTSPAWPSRLPTATSRTARSRNWRGSSSCRAIATTMPGWLFWPEAMKQADRNEDKRMILDRVREVHTFAAVRFAAGFLDQPRLASQVCATIADLLHREEIRNPNQAEANKIIDQVIAVSKDKSLVERVKSFKSAN